MTTSISQYYGWNPGLPVILIFSVSTNHSSKNKTCAHLDRPKALLQEVVLLVAALPALVLRDPTPAAGAEALESARLATLI